MHLHKIINLTYLVDGTNKNFYIGECDESSVELFLNGQGLKLDYDFVVNEGIIVTDTAPAVGDELWTSFLVET